MQIALRTNDPELTKKSYIQFTRHIKYGFAFGERGPVKRQLSLCLDEKSNLIY